MPGCASAEKAVAPPRSILSGMPVVGVCGGVEGGSEGRQVAQRFPSLFRIQQGCQLSPACSRLWTPVLHAQLQRQVQALREPAGSDLHVGTDQARQLTATTDNRPAMHASSAIGGIATLRDKTPSVQQQRPRGRNSSQVVVHFHSNIERRSPGRQCLQHGHECATLGLSQEGQHL